MAPILLGWTSWTSYALSLCTRCLWILKSYHVMNGRIHLSHQYLGSWGEVMQKWISMKLWTGDIYDAVLWLEIGDIYHNRICENVRPTLIFGWVEVSLGAPGMLLVLMVTIEHWCIRPNMQGLYTFSTDKDTGGVLHCTAGCGLSEA